MIPETVPVGVFVHVDPGPGHGDHGKEEDEHDDGDEEADGHAAPGPVLPNTGHPALAGTLLTAAHRSLSSRGAMCIGAVWTSHSLSQEFSIF